MVYRARTDSRHGIVAAALAVLFFVVLPRTATAAEGDSPPVLLRDALLLTPAETAGTGLAPELSVRVTIDRRGKVRHVEVLSIAPPSEYDELFRKITVDALEGWRYAPAIKDGQPSEATLEWTIQFQAKGGSRTDPSARIAPFVTQVADRTQIFTFSLEHQALRLDELSELAEAELTRSNRRRADTPRFVVITDAPSPETAAALAGNLEAVFELLNETFRPEIELQTSHYKLVSYVFWKRSAFRAFSAPLVEPEWVNGLYMPPGLFAYHLETGTVDVLLSTMIHELVHGYMDQHVVRPGLYLPPWVGEGTAEYFARSEIKDGRLVPGSVRKGEYVLDQRLGGAYRRTTETGWSVDAVKRAIRAGKAVDVETLLTMDYPVFLTGNVPLHYAMSWMMVHFLIHGEPEWEHERFPDLLLYLAEGYPTDAALREVYGVEPADLEEPFRTYVKRF